jgi:hypothetical protein
VLGWLVEVAEHLRAFSRYVWCEMHVRQAQWDALDAVWRDVKEGKLSEEEAGLDHGVGHSYSFWPRQRLVAADSEAQGVC